MPVVLVLPLVGDLVGAVVPVSVGLVHDAGVEAADHLGDDPLDVVHDGVGVGVGGDVLVVGRLPEGDHVLPDGTVHNVSTQTQNIFYMKQIFLVVIFRFILSCVLSEPLWLVLEGAPRAGDGDLVALVAEVGLGLGVELDVLGPESLDELLAALQHGGGGHGGGEDGGGHQEPHP